MKKVFTYVPAITCGYHEHIPVGQRNLLSCGCGLADSGCFMIIWDGPGLGFVCENEEEAKHTAYRMNTAWHLALGGKR